MNWRVAFNARFIKTKKMQPNSILIKHREKKTLEENIMPRFLIVLMMTWKTRMMKNDN